VGQDLVMARRGGEFDEVRLRRHCQAAGAMVTS